MKKFSIFSIAAALLLAGSGCTKDISTTINKNPKATSDGIGTALFSYGQQQLANTINTTSVSTAPFRVISQEWTENAYTYEANYVLNYYNSPGGFWNVCYINTIHNLDQAKQNFPVGFLGTPGQLRNDIIITDMMVIYTYYMLMATYGDIPYTQADNPTIPFPKYDAAATVYADLLTRIDTCIAGLDVSQPAMGAADEIYGGDVPSWLKFGASLKLKMAMLNALKDPTTTGKKVNEAIATGLFTSNADDALFTYDPASPVNSSPVWNALVYSHRHDFVPASLLVNTMTGWNDPRLPLYFTNYPANTNQYLGGTPGASNGYGQYSDFCCAVNNSVLYSPSYPGPVLDYTEVEFYLAEAAAQGLITTGVITPTAYYDSAITSSIKFWGGNDIAAQAYLAQPSVAYATAAGTWQQKIGYQEFIANYDKNWDSWTDERRLGFPDIDVVSVPLLASGNFPLRFYYPPNETTSNPTNTAAAAANLPGGQDVVSAKLFWEP
jgi:hypothetical protein